MPLDSSILLAAVSEAAPTGPNLEFDPDFSALDRAAQGKPEQQYGDTIIAAEAPDWREVEARAQALLERTRDLRVLTHLAIARLHLVGLAGYAESLALTRQLLEARWEDIHPQLDPDDDNDPTLRANAVLPLAHPGRVLKHLRDLPLASSPRVGSYGLRDIAAATAEPGAPRDGSPRVKDADIRAAFQDSDPARLAGLREAAAAAAAAAQGIVAVFQGRAGYGTEPDYSALLKVLAEITREIDKHAGLVPAAEPAAAAPARPAAQGATAAMLTEVTTRGDALRLLDLVCQYYRRHEPSSPLPLLLERARRLAEKDFIEILRELAPDGLQQATMVVGARDE
jgi:type VI secretion system protein ImpA